MGISITTLYASLVTILTYNIACRQCARSVCLNVKRTWQGFINNGRGITRWLRNIPRASQDTPETSRACETSQRSKGIVVRNKESRNKTGNKKKLQKLMTLIANVDHSGGKLFHFAAQEHTSLKSKTQQTCA